MSQPVVYIGFSTVDRTAPPWTYQDVELVKRDLLNTFNTPRGERVMRPTYGTIIYDLLMDPFDDVTRDGIVEDVTNIIEQEPRVELVSLDVNELDQTMRVDVTLNFIPQNVTDVLFIEYDRRNQEQI